MERVPFSLEDGRGGPGVGRASQPSALGVPSPQGLTTSSSAVSVPGPLGEGVKVMTVTTMSCSLPGVVHWLFCCLLPKMML